MFRNTSLSMSQSAKEQLAERRLQQKLEGDIAFTEYQKKNRQPACLPPNYARSAWRAKANLAGSKRRNRAHRDLRHIHVMAPSPSLLAQSGHPQLHRTCPLLGVKQTSKGFHTNNQSQRPLTILSQVSVFGMNRITLSGLGADSW